MRKPPSAATKGPGKPPRRSAIQLRRLRYTTTLGREICRRVAEGVDVRALAGAPGMPPWPTILKWIETVDEFRTAWLNARAGHAELLIDEALALARGVKSATLPETKVKLAELHWQVATRRAAAAAFAGRGAEDGDPATAAEKAARVRRALTRLDAPALARITEDRHGHTSASRLAGGSGARGGAVEAVDRDDEGDDAV
ncbi:MAG: hypothetical protein IPK81_15775 [Rhodospirillales bacterium]|nr:MAG: hypothetical protein IPK81_15775 [Rhodospirillales bacterium]